MSVRLRIKYQVRSFAQSLLQISMPNFLIGRFAKFGVTALVIFFMAGYFVQIGHLNTSGYEIAKLEKRVEDLRDEQKQLNTQLASEQSIGKIQKRLEGIHMKTADNIKYIKFSETAVAQR